MDERTFGRSQQHASVVGLGTWQLGADWGDVDDKEALSVLEAAAESGVTFFDTADVYGDGRSEQTIAAFLSGRPDLHVLVATKMGRRLDQIPENYVLDNFRAWNDRSRRNLGVDRIDLVQLHCPPTPVYSSDEVFDALDTLVEEERIAHYGVSVETCEEALTAIARPALPASLLATAKPKAAEMEVELWAAPNGSYSLSLLLVKPESPPPWRRVRIRSRRPVNILCG